MTDKQIESLSRLQEDYPLHPESPLRPYRRISEDPEAKALVKEMEDDMAHSITPAWLQALSIEGALLSSYKSHLQALREAKRDALERESDPQVTERIKGALECLKEQLNYLDNVQAEAKRK